MSTGNDFYDFLPGQKPAPKPSSGANPFTDTGSILGAFSQGKKADRLVQGSYTQDYDKMMLDREALINKMMLEAQEARNRNETDAFKKLQSASYVAGGGANTAPTNISIRGVSSTLPSFGFAPKPKSAEEVAAATSLRDQMASRLQNKESFAPSFSYTPHALDDYAKPGLIENLASYGGAASGIIGAIPGISSALGLGGGAGTAAAGAGAAGGGMGAIGALMTNPWTIGIGAGLAAIPLLKKAFGGPNEEEKAGRATADSFISQFTSSASPAQRAEASAAGWANPEQALAQIVLRDQLAAKGKPPALAGQLMSQLLDSVSKSKDPRAVSQAVASINQTLA